ILVVDDGSHDATAEIVSEFPAVRLIRHSVNRGYGGALKTGLRHACGDYLSFLDADGTYPPEYLPNLCQPLLQNQADLVIGSRMAGAHSEMPLVRRIGNLLFAGMLGLISNQKVRDSASGMRVFRRDILERLYPLPDGLNFTPVMSTRALHEGVRLQEIPIPYSERVGRSKLNPLKDGVRFLQTIVWTAMGYNPVQVLGLLGLACLFLAGALGLGILGLRLRGVTALGPWSTFALFGLLVCSVSGISLLNLGITLNYLVALFHKRPVQQGLFGRPFLPRLDHHFVWIGSLVMAAGLFLSIGSLVGGLHGFPLDRLWFYLLCSALLILVGLQLIISWALIRILDELSQREMLVQADLSDPPNYSKDINAPLDVDLAGSFRATSD
ncbi:MAG: glycosyltransferase family 2 protein, partial [Chloroflexi bacterium]|nr:glycosyltransferase family 2 protein [Chloroflexota bacterium]